MVTTRPSTALDVVVVDCGSEKVEAIHESLGRAGARPRIVPLDDAPERDWTEPGAVVISGGPRLFTDEQGLAERFVFLDRIDGAVLGICLGHQALGLRHGARVFRGAERRESETVEVLSAHPLLQGLPEPPSFATDHCEGISLPNGFELVARSTHYEVEIMAHPSKPRFGVQFHPEVSGEAGHTLIRNFVRLALRAAR